MSLKKRICAVSMAALMVCCSTNVQADTWYSIANLNIRENPDKESKAIGKYLRDEEVNVIEYNEDGWSKTDKGYVSSKYLSKTQGSYESSDKNRIVSSEVSESEYPLSYKNGKESITISRANLDGGGSSTMLFEGKLLNSPSDGKERNDADFLYIGGNRK